MLNYTLNTTIPYLHGIAGAVYDPATIVIGDYSMSPMCYQTMMEIKFNYFNFEFSRILAYMFGVMLINFIFYKHGINILSWLRDKELWVFERKDDGAIAELYDHISLNLNRFVMVGYILLMLKYIFMSSF